MDKENIMNDSLKNYSQKELDELYPYLLTLHPGARIQKVEKVSLYDLMNSADKQNIPIDLNSEVINSMKNEVDLKKLGAVKITMEDGEEYYVQEGNPKMTKLINMDTSLADESVYRERFYKQAINQHEREKKGGTKKTNKRKKSRKRKTPNRKRKSKKTKKSKKSKKGKKSKRKSRRATRTRKAGVAPPPRRPSPDLPLSTPEVSDNEDESFPGHIAAERGDIEGVRNWLGSRPGDTSLLLEQMDDVGETMLFIAAENGHANIVRILIDDYGADIRNPSINGSDVLEHAREGAFNIEVTNIIERRA